MNNKLKFHIDSARAFSHFENKDKLSEMARKNNELNEMIFESFILINLRKIGN